MTKNEIEDVLRRPATHWTIDGLSELLVGILFLFWGMAIGAQHLWPSRLTAVLAAWVPAAICLALAVFYGPISNGLNALKARWTYPRVGYVKVPGPSRARKVAAMLVGGAAAILVAWIVIAVLPRHGIRLWMPIAMGVTYAVGFALFWLLLGLGRLLVYAGASLAAGALSQRLFSADLGVGVVLSSVGAVLIIGGSIALRHLLRLPLTTEDQP